MYPTICLMGGEDFRKNLVTAMRNKQENAYIIPSRVPKLFKYIEFKNHSINNILNSTLPLTRISRFNDIFDSKIQYVNLESKIEEEYKKDCESAKNTGSQYSMPKEYYKDYYEDIIDDDFGFLDDSYCSCFSEINNSTLMWSHYADSNKGICIEYDFEKIKESKAYLYNSLFPVSYTDAPIDLNDYLDRFNNNKCNNAIEVGLTATMLNKAKCWGYEHEWRVVMHSDCTEQIKYTPYIPFAEDLHNIEKVILGYNILDNFLCENLDDIKTQMDNLKLLKELLEYLIKENIQLAIMLPEMQTYELKPLNINAKSVNDFLDKKFYYDEKSDEYKKPEEISFKEMLQREFLQNIIKK